MISLGKTSQNVAQYDEDTGRTINRLLLLQKKLHQTIPKQRKIRNFLLLKLLQQEEDLKKLLN